MYSNQEARDNYIPPKPKGILTQAEAFKYIFSFTNNAGAKMLGVPYEQFAQTRHAYIKGKLGHVKIAQMMEVFGFTTLYQSNEEYQSKNG